MRLELRDARSWIVAMEGNRRMITWIRAQYSAAKLYMTLLGCSDRVTSGPAAAVILFVRLISHTKHHTRQHPLSVISALPENVLRPVNAICTCRWDSLVTSQETRLASKTHNLAVAPHDAKLQYAMRMSSSLLRSDKILDIRTYDE